MTKQDVWAYGEGAKCHRLIEEEDAVSTGLGSMNSVNLWSLRIHRSFLKRVVAQSVVF